VDRELAFANQADASGREDVVEDGAAMAFCEHCEGQRFDRAQVLRLLRATRKSFRKNSRGDAALRAAIQAVRALEIPHLERVDEPFDGPVVH
jgi:hypothetical protein